MRESPNTGRRLFERQRFTTGATGVREEKFAQEPIPFVIGESMETGEIVIIQISDALFDFFRLLGIPMCPVSQAV